MIPGRGNPAMRLYEITLVWCVLKSVPLRWHLQRLPLSSVVSITCSFPNLLFYESNKGEPVPSPHSNVMGS